MACGDTRNAALSDQDKKPCNGDCENCGAVSSLLDKLDPQSTDFQLPSQQQDLQQPVACP